jgi:hypothetical protein
MAISSALSTWLFRLQVAVTLGAESAARREFADHRGEFRLGGAFTTSRSTRFTTFS